MKLTTTKMKMQANKDKL